jgi:hypothetical protein
MSDRAAGAHPCLLTTRPAAAIRDCRVKYRWCPIVAAKEAHRETGKA